VIDEHWPPETQFSSLSLQFAQVIEHVPVKLQAVGSEMELLVLHMPREQVELSVMDSISRHLPFFFKEQSRQAWVP
jgi:hypothetical protein